MCKYKGQQDSGGGDKESMRMDLRWPTALAFEQIQALSFELDVSPAEARCLHQAGYRCVDDLYYVTHIDLRDALQAEGQSLPFTLLRHIISRVDLIEQSAHQDREAEGMLLSLDDQFLDLGGMQPPYEFPPVFSQAINSSSLCVELGQSKTYTAMGGEGNEADSKQALGLLVSSRDHGECKRGDDGAVSDSCTSLEVVGGGSLRSGVDLFGGGSKRLVTRLPENSHHEERSMGVSLHMGVVNKPEALFEEGDGRNSEIDCLHDEGVGLFSTPFSPISRDDFPDFDEVTRQDESPPWSP